MLPACKLRFVNSGFKEQKRQEAAGRQGGKELTFWQEFAVLRSTDQATKDPDRVFSSAGLYC